MRYVKLLDFFLSLQRWNAIDFSKSLHLILLLSMRNKRDIQRFPLGCFVLNGCDVISQKLYFCSSGELMEISDQVSTWPGPNVHTIHPKRYVILVMFNTI